MERSDDTREAPEGASTTIRVGGWPADLEPSARFVRLANEAKQAAFWGAETDDPMPTDEMFLRAAMALDILTRLKHDEDTAGLMVCLIAANFAPWLDTEKRREILSLPLVDPGAELAAAVASNRRLMAEGDSRVGTESEDRS